MPRRIESPHSSPGRMLRGAIQQRTPLPSRKAQIASAVDLSVEEWLMKTSMGGN